MEFAASALFVALALLPQSIGRAIAEVRFGYEVKLKQLRSDLPAPTSEEK